MQTHHLQTTLLMAGNLFFLLLFFFHSMAFMWPCCCWFCLVLVIAVLCTWLPAIQRPKLESLNDGAGLEMTLMIIHIASLKRQLFHYFPRLLGKGHPLIRSCAGGRIPAVSHRSQTHSAWRWAAHSHVCASWQCEQALRYLNHLVLPGRPHEVLPRSSLAQSARKWGCCLSAAFVVWATLFSL